MFSAEKMDEERSELVAKVPQVTFLFWVVKILATTLGETGGDAVTMSWLGETTAESKGTGYLIGTAGTGYLIGTAIFGVIFVVTVLVQIKAKKFHPFLYWLTIVATTTVGTHRLYRRFNHLAHLCDRVASDLALVDGEHIDRNSEYAEGRNFLLGDNHVFPNLGDSAWRLGGRHE